MLQPDQIKEEELNSPNEAFPMCTCKHKVKGEREVLVNFGLSRKKVFSLSDMEDKLHESFTKYILSDPAFSELLKDSYVVFQQFCQKFGTWVDVDINETLQDGAVLNAVFFPSKIERDESNPGSIRKKEVQIVSERSAKPSKKIEVINIDLCGRKEVSDNSVKNQIHNESINMKVGEEQNIPKADTCNKTKNFKEEDNRKNKRPLKNNEVLTAEKAVHSIPKKAKCSKVMNNKINFGNGRRKSSANQNLYVSSTYRRYDSYERSSYQENVGNSPVPRYQHKQKSLLPAPSWY